MVEPDAVLTMMVVTGYDDTYEKRISPFAAIFCMKTYTHSCICLGYGDL